MDLKKPVTRKQVELICIQQYRKKPKHPSYFDRLLAWMWPVTLFLFGQIKPELNMSKLLNISRRAQEKDREGLMSIFFKDNLRKAAPVWRMPTWFSTTPSACVRSSSRYPWRSCRFRTPSSAPRTRTNRLSTTSTSQRSYRWFVSCRFLPGR